MDIDINDDKINENVNKKCTMLIGSLQYREKYFKKMKQKKWIFPKILQEYKESPPSKVCYFIISIDILISLIMYIKYSIKL